MNKFNPDTYCGIYCGACSIVMHGETGRADAFADCLKNVPKEDLACNGCKSGIVYAGCSTCSLRRCARDKGVEHCIDCTDFPCRMYSKWQSAAKFLPHSREAAASLEAIKRGGVEAWLAAQEKRWSCPDCGSPISWYAQKCNKCGLRLAKAYELSGWRKLLCRLVIPMAYRKGKAKRLTDALP
jgi:hypothetical protein